MRIAAIGVVLALVFALSSCGGTAQQIGIENGAKLSSAVTQDWVNAWNANRAAFRFQPISSWDETRSFGSLYSGSSYPADAASFTNAMAQAMQKPNLVSPASGSLLGIWWDAEGDDLE